MRDAFKYLSSLGDRGPKPNFDAFLTARFARAHAAAQAAIAKARIPAMEALLHRRCKEACATASLLERMWRAERRPRDPARIASYQICAFRRAIPLSRGELFDMPSRFPAARR